MESNNQNSIIIKLGIFTKTLIIILISFYLLSFLNKNFAFIFSNMLIFTVFWGELWRLLTGPFISESFSQLFLNLAIISLVLNFFENIEGTLKTFKSFLVHLLLIQLLQLFLTLLVVMLFSINQFYIIKSVSLLNAAYILEVIFIMNKKHITTFQSVQINNRFLLLFYMFFYIGISLSLSSIFELGIALLYGFLICKYKGIVSVLADEIISTLEKNEGFRIIINLDGYITLEDSSKSLLGIKPEVEDLEQTSTTNNISGAYKKEAKLSKYYPLFSI